MELKGRYPWQSMKSSDYISKYRHFVTTCRVSAPQALFVWSPAGDIGLKDYWPGPEYVDEIGLSVFSFGEFEKVTFGRLQSFTDIFKAKYNRVKGYGKPIMIAELGITGDRESQKNWIDDLSANRWRFPLLHSAIYFNAPDTVAWPRVGIPDWTLHTAVFLL
jgi:beta-mannanase